MIHDFLFSKAVTCLLVAFLFSEAAWAARKVEAPLATPARVLVGSSGTVLVTVKIGSKVRKKTVRLYREKRIAVALNKRVRSWKAQGKMNDSGAAGDVSAGDGIYSLRIPIRETVTGWVRLRASLQSGGGLKWSPVSSIVVAQPTVGVMPNLQGLERAEAELRLQQAGLLLGNVTERVKIFMRTGNVLEQSTLPDTDILEGTAVDLVVSALPPVKPGEALPATWAGRWQLVTVYRNATTDAVDSVVEVIENLCAGDPVGLGLVERAADGRSDLSAPTCSGQATEDRLQFDCASQVSLSLCSLAVSSGMSLQLKQDTILGAGAWKADGPCSLPLRSQGQTMSLRGTRLGPIESGVCTKPASSFLQKFVRNPLTVLFEEAL